MKLITFAVAWFNAYPYFTIMTLAIFAVLIGLMIDEVKR